MVGIMPKKDAEVALLGDSEDPVLDRNGPMVEIELNEALEAVGLGMYHYRVNFNAHCYLLSRILIFFDVVLTPGKTRELIPLALI